MSGIYQFGNVSPLYTDAGCPTQCYANNEYADLSDYYGAVPIPPSTAIRIYNTPLSVNQKTYEIETPARLTEQQVQQVVANANASKAAADQEVAQAEALLAQYIRMRRN
jgi:hypothetical protein